MAKQLTPAIVFAFSRKECEGAAMTARSLEPLEPEQVEQQGCRRKRRPASLLAPHQLAWLLWGLRARLHTRQRSPGR